MKHALQSLFAVAVAVACVPAADAAVLAYDDFDGYTSGALNGQTSTTAVGIGAWGAGSANIQAEGGGILDGDATNGQGKFVPVGQAFPAYRTNNAQLTGVAGDPPGNTFYTSQLVNAGTTGGLDGEYAFVGFGSFVDQGRIEGNANFLLGGYVGFVNQGDGSVDLVLRSRTGAVAPNAVTETTLVEDAGGNTYQVVLAIEYNNPGDEIRYWVDPTNFIADEAGLTASAAVSGSVSGFQLGAFSDMNRLTVGTTFTNRSFFFDEAILATDVRNLGAVPEPTAALLAAAGLALAATRRR